MKKILASLIMLFASILVYSQAYEGTVESQKTQQQAAIIELPYHPDIVTAALNDYLIKKGKSRGDDIKGFTTFRNTQPIPSDSVNADLFFKMERKSRKEKEVTVVSLLLTAPKEGIEPENVHHLNMEQAKTYLNGLVPAIEAFNLELQIKDQNSEIVKAENKYKSLVDDGNDLENKRKGLDKKIQDNKMEQLKQLTEVGVLKQKLSSWVNQRKG